uniref:Uncharacterized protein n=1 Tax=Ornithorhynchus anatinus TaxID=9258 RepID=A0A6I8NQ85_ORNAN
MGETWACLKAEGKEPLEIEWLKIEPIPRHKVNLWTIEILCYLAGCNQTQDKNFSLVIEALKQKAVECFKANGE